MTAGIGAALLLRNRGVAVVQVEVPDYFTTRDGVQFRPNLVAATQPRRLTVDHLQADDYRHGVRQHHRDCARRRGPAGQDQALSLLGLRIGEAREALELIYDSADAFTAEVEKLCAEVVTDAQWLKVLDSLVAVLRRRAGPRPRPSTSATRSTTCGSATPGSSPGRTALGECTRPSTRGASITLSSRAHTGPSATSTTS